MNVAYIGIGSNLGDRFQNCSIAIDKISSVKDTRILAVSDWFENPALVPDKKIDQPDFVNGVVKIETPLTPEILLERLKEIETSMGRPETNEKWSARTIDLDILFYDNLIIDSENLKIPHSELHKRVFVLKPLCDIEPGLIHPKLKTTVEELLSKI